MKRKTARGSRDPELLKKFEEALYLVTRGVSVTKACEISGFKTSSFYTFWYRKRHEEKYKDIKGIL